MTTTLIVFALNMGALMGEPPQSPPAPVGVSYVDVQAIFTPVSLVSTRKVIGGGKTAGLWTVSYCQDSARKVPIDRARALAQAPAVRALPNALAEDAIGRQGAADVKSIIGNNGDQLLSFVGTAVSLGGFATGSRNSEIAGLGITGLQVLFRLLKKAAPDATPYFSGLLPDTVEVPAAGCTPSFYLFASLAPNVHTIIATVKVPLLQ